MGLRDNIPGLSRHRTGQQVQAQASEFDRPRVEKLIADAVDLLNGYYPAGALEWVRNNRPDLADTLRDKARAIDAAVVKEDLPTVRRALTVYVDAHRQAFDLFREQPPSAAVDLQRNLF